MRFDAALAHAVWTAIPDRTVRSATLYWSPTETVKVTRQRKPDRRAKQETFILTIGTPNFAERKFIALAKKAGESFPIRKVQIKRYPVK